MQNVTNSSKMFTSPFGVYEGKVTGGDNKWAAQYRPENGEWVVAEYFATANAAHNYLKEMFSA